MALRYRRMTQEDVKACVSLQLRHPLHGPQYGMDSESIARAWMTLDGLDAFQAVVFEEFIGEHTRLLGPGVCVAVTGEFAEEIKTPPFFWLGPEMARRVASGRSPLLSNDELRKTNATAGVNVVAWPSSPSAEDSARMDINQLYMGTFIQLVRGYRLKELFFQTPVAGEAMAVVQWGAAVPTKDGIRSNFRLQEMQNVIKKPYVLIMNPRLAFSRFGSWASGLFVPQEPQMGFSRGEQRLLEEAVRGGSDEELAEELEISLSAVKKAWRSIYDRVGRSSIDIFPRGSDDSAYGERGKGKKHRLLTYVREHPEELRPISFKLLGQFYKKPKPRKRTSHLEREGG